MTEEQQTIIRNAFALPRMATLHEATIAAAMTREARKSGNYGTYWRPNPVKVHTEKHKAVGRSAEADIMAHLAIRQDSRWAIERNTGRSRRVVGDALDNLLGSGAIEKLIAHRAGKDVIVYAIRQSEAAE